MVEVKYEWVDYYMELANKLVPFANDHESLIRKIKNPNDRIFSLIH